MIGDTLNYIRLELRDHLGLQDDDIALAHLHAPRVRGHYHGIRIALVNVTAEPALRAVPQDLRRTPAQSGNSTATLPLNLHIVIAFDLDDYRTSLNLLAHTHGFLHDKPIFDAATQRAANPFPASLQRLVLDMTSCDLAELSQLWSVNGGVLLPSLLYRVRVVHAGAA